ncbi:TlyA family RNA methyltransferase [Clostridium aestuarii]|uniref:TlyA family RNA methyltransferase n=1 Tax=Clostridium aestuarii TaxID=338193 RepID=A0ABT4CXR0_9CLOT|nr:TlyA family RNA methyltransferase [Clostridium aestuarii]MCY6483765.1 TlyA family RNA methyltransferase [Clostridium aestuarii]
MSSVEKKRLDMLLIEKDFFDSREKAKASIMAGEIFVDGNRVDKCGQKVPENSKIEFKGKVMPYVSRGGFKLEKAMKSFNIDLKDKVCMDIGASTGGFTDCMLQNGAKKVFAVDVGYGQFAWKLRTDPRVVCMERTNARYLTNENIGEYANFASIDVSFISLKKIIPAIVNILDDKGEISALIKPQFEAGRDKVGKKGVVKDINTHKEVILDILNFLLESDLRIKGLQYSPIKGPEGNREYLVYFTKDKSFENNFDKKTVDLVVDLSHENL